MKTYFKTLALDGATFEAVKADTAGLATALKLFFAVGLILALGQLGALVGIRQQETVYQGVYDASAALEAASVQMDERVGGRFMPGFISNPVQRVAQTLTEVSESLTELGNVLEAGQPPLGKGASQAIIVVGQWLASPFDLLATWLVAAAFVFICAKILGGQGSLREHMGLVLLAFAPQVLTIVGSFSFVLALESLAGILYVVAGLWSLTILIVALRRAHGFSAGRAAGTLVLACVLVGASGLLTALFWGAVLAAFVSWLL